MPGGDRGGPSFGERNDGGDNGTPGEAMPELPKPCDQIKGAFKDPVVNQAALRALKNSVFSTIEFGFFVSKAPRGKI